MEKKIIVGFDLSYNSTGITISYLEDNVGKAIQFHRIVFDDNTTKKIYKPQDFKNVNTITYRLPTNILVTDMVFDMSDKNNIEQCEATIKSLILSKKIGKIVANALNLYNPTEAIFCIENYIMPSFAGRNQLKVVSGLIMLQAFVREVVIRFCLELKIQLKLFTPAPKSNKLFFTADGNADKTKMLKTFLEEFDGKKLLPSVTIDSVAHINDVIDSFALMMYAYSKINKNNFQDNDNKETI